MQRRWAAIYLAFFVVMAASAYSIMAVAEEPEIDVEGESFVEGDTVEFDGTTYVFTEVSDNDGTIEFEETGERQESFANESDIQFRNDTYRVRIPPGEEPQNFTLEQQFDVEALLEADDAVENETITREDGNEYVVFREDGSTQQLEEYLPDPDRETFRVNDTIEHDNETKTVTEITPQSATVTWTGTITESIDITEGDVVALGGTDYVMTFTDEDTVLLSTDVEGYETDVDERENFEERMSGLLFVVMFSLGSGVVVGALAFLPRRG